MSIGAIRIYLVLVLLGLVMIGGDCRRNKQKLAEQAETKQERETVVEANHFFSEHEKTTGYDIDSVETGKSLVFFLKKREGKDSDDKQLANNPITITLTAGQDSTSCLFDSYSKLCSLSKVDVDKMKLKIQCKSTPCELSWEIIQPAVQQDDGEHQFDQLVAVNAENNHAALRVTCDNPELKETFASTINLYTNSKYQRVDTKMGTVYFLFNNEEKGYYFVKTEDQKAAACAKAQLNHADETIAFNDDKQSHFDFIGPNASNTYQFKSIPTSDFRVEFTAHDITFNKLANTTGVSLKLYGFVGGNRKSINNITLFVDDEKEAIDFSTIYKKPTQKYDKMELQLHGIGSMLIIETRFIASDTQEVEMGEQSYFSLQKGDKLKFHINPLVISDDTTIKRMYIFAEDAKMFKTNETSCDIKGCIFELQALETGSGSVYIGEEQTKNTKEIIVLPFDKTVSASLKEGDERYYSTKLKKDHSLELLINTPNVIAYSASKTKCPQVDEVTCYQKIFTFHNPTVYEPTADDTLLIKVIALQNSQFAITAIQETGAYIQLKDTVPFAYLFDNQENRLLFSFTLPSKQDVTFNLVGPTNQLDLLVLNKEKPEAGDEENSNWANDGFIKFQSKDINSLKFLVQVRKREAFRDKWIHFTLVASSKAAVMQLQPGIAHYQNLKPKDSKNYMFEFQPKKRILLNFYTHNIKTAVNLRLKVSNARQYNDTDNTAEFVVDREVDVLNMQLVSKKLCSQQRDNCEIYLQLLNEMDVEVDTTLTLLVDDSVVELKDGVWQNYNINFVSATTHFYFIPNHVDHSTTIYYKSTLVDLKIMYNIWKTDSKNMNPANWPFPLEFKENEKLSELQFKPLHFIHIESAQLKECWPNCVVLLSIAPDVAKLKAIVDADKKKSYDNEDFKIMASNNFIEVPERHKVDIPMIKAENKEILIDLKYHLDKEVVTIYNYQTLGNVNLKANVYTEKNPRCPTPDDDADFPITGMQTDLTIEDIKTKLSENSMEGDNTPFICILATASSDSKFSIEWTSDKNSIKTLAIDTVTPLSAASGEKHMYQIDVSQQVYLKVIRDEGFPYFTKKLCKPEDTEIGKCVQDFEEEESKGIQLADKVTTYDTESCDKCTLLLKVTALEPIKAEIHTQSKYAEIQLTQNKALSDALAPNEENRYTLTGTKNQEIVINIQLISGNIKVEVHDFQKIDLKKSNAANSKNVHIVIPPKDMAKPKQQSGAVSMTAFTLSSFVHLHLIVTSQNPKEGAIYTITYTSGETIYYLQDGLIAQYNLVAKKATRFLYRNPTVSNVYLHISAPDAGSLGKLAVKMFALNDPEDQDSMVSMTPQKPDFKKKTPNPTMLMLLPAKQTYMIQLTNNNDKDTLFTLGINNREIIYLPFDHEFPVRLGKTQYIYIVLYNTVAGYIKLSFSKCDQSQPFIGYTLDYNEFVNEDFQVEEQMTDQLSQDLIIKVKEQGGIYIKLRSPDDDTTLMSVKAVFSNSKIMPSKAKPGDKGLIQYQLLDSTKAELTFTTLVCGSSEKNCNKDFTYSSLTSSKIQNIYAQLVCPSIMFDLPDTQQLKAADLTPISTSSIKNNKITFTQAIKNEIEYVGVKAVNSKTGEVVYYQPVELVTFWGQVHRASLGNVVVGLALLCLFICGAMLIFRRLRKNKEYSNLGEMNDQIQ